MKGFIDGKNFNADEWTKWYFDTHKDIPEDFKKQIIRGIQEYHDKLVRDEDFFKNINIDKWHYWTLASYEGYADRPDKIESAIDCASHIMQFAAYKDYDSIACSRFAFAMLLLSPSYERNTDVDYLGPLKIRVFDEWRYNKNDIVVYKGSSGSGIRLENIRELP